MRNEEGRFEDRLLEMEKPLYHFALTLAGNPVDAMDLTQETFLKALKNRSSFTPGTNLKAWLSRIMRNAFIDQRRRKRYEPTPVESPEDAGGPAPELRPNQLVAEDVQRALEQLEPDHRALLVLCDLHGYRYREIAEILDIPLGTCMSRIHRARRKLRDRLAALQAAGS